MHFLSHMPNSRSSERVRLGVLIAAGVIARMCAIWAFRDDLVRDRDAYLALAEGWLRTGGLSDPITGAATAFRPPLYPLVLAPLVACFGRAGAVATLNVLSGALSIWLAWWLGRFQFGGRSRTGRIPLAPPEWCAVLVAFDPLLLRYSSQPMTEVLAATLFLAALAAIARTLSAGGVREALAWAGCAGVLAGACALCRPVFWAAWALAALLGLLWVVFVPRVAATQPLARDAGHARAAGDGRASILPAGGLTDFRPSLPVRLAVALAGFALVVTPWAVRNALQFGAPILTTTHGGYTLYLANNPWFYAKVVRRGWSAVLSAEDLAALQRHAEATIRTRQGGAPGEVERDRIYYELAWQQIRRSPYLFLRACVVRTLRFWSIVPLVPPNRGRIGRLSIPAVGALYSAELAAALWGVAEVVVALCVVACAARRRLLAAVTPDTDAAVLTVKNPRIVRRLRAAMRLLDGPSPAGPACRDAGTPSDRPWTLAQLQQARVLVWLTGLAAIVAFTLVHAIYWSNARMRAPLMPVVSLFATVPVLYLRTDRAAGR